MYCVSVEQKPCYSLVLTRNWQVLTNKTDASWFLWRDVTAIACSMTVLMTVLTGATEGGAL